MSTTQELVQKAVDKINEDAKRATESKISDLVNRIVQNDSAIRKLQKDNEGYKKELKELQEPTPVSLDLG